MDSATAARPSCGGGAAAAIELSTSGIRHFLLKILPWLGLTRFWLRFAKWTEPARRSRFASAREIAIDSFSDESYETGGKGKSVHYVAGVMCSPIAGLHN